MSSDSLLIGENAPFLDELYTRWLADPRSVEPQWQAYFQSLPAESNGVPMGEPTPYRPSIFEGGPGTAVSSEPAAASRQAKVVQLINAFRVRGHLAAKIDPLGRRELLEHEELTLGYYGLSDSDLDVEVDTAPAYGLPPRATLRALIEHLRRSYCRSIGAEFMNIMDNRAEEAGSSRTLETSAETSSVLSPAAAERRVFRKLCDAENFERMLHNRFPGTKRFSLEGGETLVPLARPRRQLCIARTESTRSSWEWPTADVSTRSSISSASPPTSWSGSSRGCMGTTQGSGDVKYHLGYSSDQVTLVDRPMHISLTPNPSHLEAVNAVVEGRVRAKQTARR